MASATLTIVTVLPITITNPGAEASATGWTDLTGTLTVHATAQTGSFSFFSSSVESAAYQDIDLTAAGMAKTDIDAYRWRLGLTWQQNALTTGVGRLEVSFFDGSASAMDYHHTINQENTTTWTLKSLEAPIPSGARTARIVQRRTGDALIDDINATGYGYPTRNNNTGALANPGAESGATTGWTVDQGGWAQETGFQGPAEGTFFWYCAATATCVMHQEIDLVADLSFSTANLDAGACAIEIDGARSTFAAQDASEIGFRFKDASSTEIGSAFESPMIVSPAQVWRRNTFTANIPASARFADLYLKITRFAGADADGNIDDLRLYSYLTVNIASPGSGQNSVIGYAPTVDATGGVTNNVTPATGIVTHLGYAAVLEVINTLLPGASVVTTTGYAPTADTTALNAVEVGRGTVTTTGNTPTVAVEVEQAASPGAGSHNVTGLAPTVGLENTVAPGASQETVTGYAPTVLSDSGHIASPGVGVINVSGYMATIGLEVTLAPGSGLVSHIPLLPTVTHGLYPSPAVGLVTAYGLAPAVDTRYWPHIPDSASSWAKSTDNGATWTDLPDDTLT